MSETKKVAPRREFMRSIGVGAVAIAATAVGVRAASAEPMLSREPDDEIWLKRLTGKHRQYFDAVSPNDGFALVFAATYLNKNIEAYGLKQSDITTVVGFRHMAAPLALNDAMWSKYKLGEFLKITDKSSNAPATRNVFSHLQPGDMPAPGAGVEELIARGAIFTACNVALTVISGLAATAAGLPPAGARDEWIANLIPGVVVVPAGVLAVNRAQENHCTYCYAG
jgi:intracellular sulfur oxidation DsrE/DsrF family protein